MRVFAHQTDDHVCSTGTGHNHFIARRRFIA
jgi:hypothetical protein